MTTHINTQHSPGDTVYFLTDTENKPYLVLGYEILYPTGADGEVYVSYVLVSGAKKATAVEMELSTEKSLSF